MKSPNPFSREAFLAPPSPPQSAKAISKLSHRPYKKRYTIGALVGAAVLAGGTFLALSSRRDRPGYPYPVTQNGLTLHAINSKRGTISPYIMYPEAYYTDQNQWVAPWVPTLEMISPKDAAPFTVTARASTGDTFYLDGGRQYALPKSVLDFVVPRNQGIWFDLPRNGVPTTYKWLDVTVQGRGNYHATWRVHNLPTLDHAVLPTAPLREKQQVGGISLNARAWWNSSTSSTTYLPYGDGTNNASNEVRDVIHAEVIARVPLSAAQQAWDVRVESFTPEWAAAALSGKSRSLNSYDDRCKGPLRGAGIAYAITTSADAPVPEVQHIAQIKALLTRYETTVETVTFHNVALAPYGNGWKTSSANKNNSITTPSGVQVTLNYMNGLPSKNDPFAPNDVYVYCYLSVDDALTVPPSNDDKNARRESRWRIAVEPVVRSGGFLSGKTIHQTYLYSDRPKATSYADLRMQSAAPIRNGVLPTLTLQVVHQTAVQTIPVTFTVPVEKFKPAKKWDNDAY